MGRSSKAKRMIRRPLLGILFTAMLAAGSAVAGSPAYAAASGCGVWRWTTPPSTTYNTGGATCASLTNGSQVRVVVYCGTTAFPPHYGPWVSTPNTYSKYICDGSEAVSVGYQTR